MQKMLQDKIPKFERSRWLATIEVPSEVNRAVYIGKGSTDTVKKIIRLENYTTSPRPPSHDIEIDSNWEHSAQGVTNQWTYYKVARNTDHSRTQSTLRSLSLQANGRQSNIALHQWNISKTVHIINSSMPDAAATMPLNPAWTGFNS